MSRVLLRWFAFLLVAGIAGLYPLRGAAAAVPEAELKAVLLFHLSQFVDWPAPAETEPFAIGILGPDEFGPALDQVVSGELVHGKPIVVKRSTHAADLTDCQIVYISPRARESLTHIRAELNRMPSLLVGDSDEFLEEGGMVRFALTANRKIRLEVQLDRLRTSGLKVSAQLLRVCIVKGSNS